MKKIETIWHHILIEALSNKQYKHTQQAIAKEFGYSLSTVNHALDKPSSIGAIRKSGKFFVLNDFWKLMMYWATYRNLEKEIIYKAKVNLSVSQIEGQISPQAVFACYSAAKIYLVEPPADYAKVYIYLKEAELNDLRKRFIETKKSRAGEANLFVLKANPHIESRDDVTSLVQTYVDIWGLADWYSRDFSLALEQKINGILS